MRERFSWTEISLQIGWLNNLKNQLLMLYFPFSVVYISINLFLRETVVSPQTKKRRKEMTRIVNRKRYKSPPAQRLCGSGAYPSTRRGTAPLSCGSLLHVPSPVCDGEPVKERPAGSIREATSPLLLETAGRTNVLMYKKTKSYEYQLDDCSKRMNAERHVDPK